MILQSLPASARLTTPKLKISVSNTPGQNRSIRVLTEQNFDRVTGVPDVPQVLVLMDQMMDKFVRPDKYITCFAMKGYDWKQLARDISDELIDVNLPYCVIYLGTMQMGIYQARSAHNDILNRIELILQRNVGVKLLVSGLVPRPLDYPDSRKKCKQINSSLQLITQDLTTKLGMNIRFVDPFLDFLKLDGTVIKPNEHFINGVFLSVTGIRLLRANWLRYFGFFPQK